MGRHELASKRQRSSVLMAAVLAPAAVFFAVGGSANPAVPKESVAVVAEDNSPGGMQLVAAPAVTHETGAPARFSVASRTRTVSRFLPAGVAPERGLQVRTIQTARSISDAFPQISQIGGVRSDALRWHPNGLALDVMIPNPTSAAGIALGDEIVAYVMENAERFGLQDAIWRGVYYTPGGGAQRGGYGHYDHVHVTTTGGGYPSGAELYLR
ncbi:glycoside hydrolase [Mycolicibacter engbaekii]|uniref:glycoside hydrolase n=1 Tax=Mycolicibacter engbaekii TaxID=188915 RepID=UPI000D6A77B1|nr:glycoside hydrolase [Mycolicibacter engbaekii]